TGTLLTASAYAATVTHCSERQPLQKDTDDAETHPSSTETHYGTPPCRHFSTWRLPEAVRRAIPCFSSYFFPPIAWECLRWLERAEPRSVTHAAVVCQLTARSYNVGS